MIDATVSVTTGSCAVVGRIARIDDQRPRHTGVMAVLQQHWTDVRELTTAANVYLQRSPPGLLVWAKERQLRYFWQPSRSYGRYRHRIRILVHVEFKTVQFSQQGFTIGETCTVERS